MADSEKTVFDKILNKEIKAETIYEDDLCLAFKDSDPQAPIHYILIPKNKGELTQLRNVNVQERILYLKIQNLKKATEKHKEILGHLLVVVSKIAQASEQLKSGFRIVINDGEEACQSVKHLHIHILGGAKLSWPPGTPGPEANKKN